jgi:hypothetical protein
MRTRQGGNVRSVSNGTAQDGTPGGRPAPLEEAQPVGAGLVVHLSQCGGASQIVPRSWFI